MATDDAPYAPARPRRTGDRSWLRRPAVFLALPCLVLAYLLLDSTPFESGYGLSKAAAANGTMVLVGPYVAVCAAYEAVVLRMFWGRWSVRRPWWQVLGQRMAPVVAAGAVVLGLIYMLSLSRGQIDPPGWQFPLLSLLGVIAWTMFGAAFGLVFGRLVALTAAALLPFLTLALPVAWEPLWLRHLNGAPVDCCSTNLVLDPRAVSASVGFLGGVLVLAVCVARVRLAPAGNVPWPTALVSVVVVVAATTLSLSARELGASPATLRPAAQLSCQEDVCLWPEDRQAFSVNQAAWQRVRSAWASLGLPAPTGRVAPVEAAGLLPIASRAQQEQQVAESMAVTLPRALLGCMDDYTDELRNNGLDQVSYLLLIELDAEEPHSLVPIGSPPPRAAAVELWQRLEPCR